MEKFVEVNDRRYTYPTQSAVVICLDGSEPDYIDVAIAEGLMPNLKAMQQSGTVRTALSAMPSFTNPNNMSIATGRPPSFHGISGNYHFDPETGEEVMMNDVRFLRSPTIFSEFQQARARVAIVTAKDKLRALLGAGLNFQQGTAICFSSERADTTTEANNGITNASAWLESAVPDVYSAALSEFVLAAGVKLLSEFKPNLMYLSTTDFIQHKFAPEEPGAKDFYAMVDSYVGKILQNNVSLLITADHGMKPKHKENGEPAILFVQDVLDLWFEVGTTKVILPITDPYVVHHGALGSFATVYFLKKVNQEKVIHDLRNTPGIFEVLSREEAVSKYELPGDRIGDITLVSNANLTLGTTKSDHDLSLLKEPLRSHGGLSEQSVPFVLNKKIDIPAAPVLRNFDAFFYATRATTYWRGP
jgi:phosphonoacetate hydrolase